MKEEQKRIIQLKKEKNAVIMAHYYVRDEVQEIADYVGDSYYLSEMAAKVENDIIVLCGVSFMGESAKLLNPDKRVLLPDVSADCPMAHMASVERIEEVRKEYEDVAVVCYVNSTAELKAYSDVCVTSSNALKVVRSLPNRNIFFIPDRHLGEYVAEKIPEKNFIFNDGYCHVHTGIRRKELEQIKAARPLAKVLVHPECQKEVTDMADYVGSTSGIISYAGKSDAGEFIVCTEMGVMYELKRQNPDKKFYTAGNMQICPNMKKITLEKIIAVLSQDSEGLVLPDERMAKANEPLKRMLQLAR